MKKFFEIMKPSPDSVILDVGGTPFNWEISCYNGKVLLLNLEIPQNSIAADNFKYVVGDGTRLEYQDNQFDIVFSNSVIEHVGDLENQKQFAYELLRVGKALWLQTPAKSFLIEPHYLAPCIHFFPKLIQKKLIRHFTLWGLLAKPSKEYIETTVEQTKLLGYRELKILFSDCEIIREKFFLFTKSFIVFRK